MKYCKNCGKILEQDNEKCFCRKKGEIINSEPAKDFPVVAIRASGFEKERICAALGDDKIPYSIRIAQKQFSSNAVTGSSNADYDILVPYGFYFEAVKLLVGINALKMNEAQLEALEKNLIKNKQDEFDIEDYYSTKNKVIRMISVVLVLAIMAGVVLGVDAVMAIIKGFFS